MEGIGTAYMMELVEIKGIWIDNGNSWCHYIKPTHDHINDAKYITVKYLMTFHKT
jgi:hypothetical protein